MEFYTQEDLFDRIYEKLNNTSDKHKLILKPPKVAYENRRTKVAGMIEISKALNRDINNILSFYKEELGKQITITGDNCFTIVGRYNEKHITTVLMSYINRYVKCKQCKSTNTLLEKYNRINKLKCLKCGSNESII